MLGDLFCLDLITEENPHGTHSPAELYRYLLDIRVWGFNNNDPAMAWNRRRYAQTGATALKKSTQKSITKISAEQLPKVFFDKLVSILPWHQGEGDKLKHGSLRWYGGQVASELLAAGKTIKEVSDIMWLTALAGVGVAPAVVRIYRSLTPIETDQAFTSLLKSYNSSSHRTMWRFGRKFRV